MVVDNSSNRKIPIKTELIQKIVLREYVLTEVLDRSLIIKETRKHSLPQLSADAAVPDANNMYSYTGAAAFTRFQP